MSDDYQRVPVEWRLEPGGRRMAMRLPDEDMWLVTGWAAGGPGVIRWRLTDDDVAEWTVVTR